MEATDNLPRGLCTTDDIRILGENIQEHNKNLISSCKNASEIELNSRETNWQFGKK